MPEIGDPSDPRLDPFRWRERRLASRTERLEPGGAGMFVAEGDLVVERAVAAGCEAVSLLCAPGLRGAASALAGQTTTVLTADDDVRREVTGLGVPLGMVGLFRRPPLRSLEQVCTGARRIVAMEAVDNPTNLGAVVRSAAGLGWDALVLDSTCADPLSRRALRVAMGASFLLPFARLAPEASLTESLRLRGFRTCALTPDPSADEIDSCADRIRDAGDPVALLFGSERAGLSGDSLAGADVRVRIPMCGAVDSLNVGAAAAIALHAFARDRRSNGDD